jgi:hypothetical protein
MTTFRALPLLAMLVAVPLQQASAQFGGMPGMPGAGGPGAGFGGPPAAPPPACRDLITLRDDTQKKAGAIQAANEKKATAQEACRLFKTFLAAEAKFIKGLEDNIQTCGVPPDAVKQAKDAHGRASTVAKKVCEAAAQGPQSAGPSLSDALGTTPTMPDGGNTRGGGMFDTLSGNALSR